MDEQAAPANPLDRPFQSLYRRFRPQRFSELVGQDHVVMALRNAVRDGHVAHAYLFSGPRGTGKTSTARILAKALNCTAQVDGEPCGVCDACTSINSGTSFDVHELDAASNNGVDAMRDLVARAALSTPGNWKVYIVDEVHMLSAAASNALLKTLEEPPDHVVFVLATTDPQKVLPTIRSRTQHFEFHLIGEDVLHALLESVAKSAELDLPDGAIQSARRRAKGSARDALSFLDQVVAAGKVDADDEIISGILAGLAATNPSQLIVTIDAALRDGRDAAQLAVELIDALRAGFLHLVGPTEENAALLSEEDLASVAAIGTARCVRTLELLGAAVVAMRDTPDPRVTLEVALVRAGYPEIETSTEALIDRIERLESRLSSLERNASGGPKSAPAMQAPNSAPPPSAVTAGPLPASPSPATSGGKPPIDSEATPTASTAARPALGAFRQKDEIAPAALGNQSGGPAPSSEPPADAPVSSVSSPAQDRPEQDRPEQDRIARPFPTRDELVLAWGDHVVARLRPKVKALFLAGRFVRAEEGVAMLALPNEAHIRAAEALCPEVSEALTTHFGTDVQVRLVVDRSPSDGPEPGRSARPGPAQSRGAQPTPEFDDATDFDDVGEIDQSEPGGGASRATEGLGLAWAEDRLLKAFPGAEELSP